MVKLYANKLKNWVFLQALFFFSCAFTPLLAESPWGKDASLHKESKPKITLSSISPMHCLISFHQQMLSAADGPRSHFYPSSSEYTRQAMCKYGSLKGFFIGCDRLLRENNSEWFYRKMRLKSGVVLKYDPVR
jgi:putative component of membrane protein insertase Oxa1/YidC/SpoIIIJ protein YidD